MDLLQPPVVIFCIIIQCGRILCAFETVRYKNTDNMPLHGPSVKYGESKSILQESRERFKTVRKLVLNYARFWGTHPCTKCNCTALTFTHVILSLDGTMQKCHVFREYSHYARKELWTQFFRADANKMFTRVTTAEGACRPYPGSRWPPTLSSAPSSVLLC
jgi:hypothetical protein